MEINLQKWADFERDNLNSVNTLAVINSAICAFLNSDEINIEILEPLFPVYRSLETLGIMSDLPELMAEEDEDDEDDDLQADE